MSWLMQKGGVTRVERLLVAVLLGGVLGVLGLSDACNAELQTLALKLFAS